MNPVRLLKSFPESNFPWTLSTQENVLWIICTVSVKGIESLFSLRRDIKLEISVQKTNKGCTSYLADSQSFLQWKSCERYQCATRETHFDSAKFDVHPLFVFVCLNPSLLSTRKLNNDLMSFSETVQYGKLFLWTFN